MLVSIICDTNLNADDFDYMKSLGSKELIWKVAYLLGLLNIMLHKLDLDWTSLR